jgi:hypothetical protein
VSQLVAFGLTLAVELPWYVGGLVALVGLRLWSALVLAVTVNVCTHPVLWWVLAPHPTLAHTLLAEVAVIVAEAALLAAAIRREFAVLGLLSLGANTSSLLIGLLFSR